MSSFMSRLGCLWGPNSRSSSHPHSIAPSVVRFHVPAISTPRSTLAKTRIERRTFTSGRVRCQDSTRPRRAYVALGSNLGDPYANIERACRALAEKAQICFRRTSSLYQTAPWGVVDQPVFLNAVCEIDTTLDPHALLDQLQDVEEKLERVRDMRWGPRTIDLDLLLYEDETIDTDRLTVPHPHMAAREFVLRPLCDIIPDHRIPHANNRSVRALLSSLPEHDKTMISMTPLTRTNKITSHPSQPTQIMSILNLTPDSFSDGGKHDPSDLEGTIRAHIEQGATIIDIGGQSSRPGAEAISSDTECARILPAIKTTKRILTELGRADVAISVDTYRARVARAALDAGAHIVNDISAGQMDAAMLATVARGNGKVVLMHMRGTPTTMTLEENTNYPNGLIPSIAHELRDRVNAALEAGVPRWNILLDPGIGFAKTAAQNLAILRDFETLRSAEGLQGLPWVVGSSRKEFIGAITGVQDAKERDWGTAGTVAAAVQGGARVVRIHAVGEMKAVVDVCDAIWRP